MCLALGWVIHGVLQKFAGDRPMRMKLVEMVVQGSFYPGVLFGCLAILKH